MILETLPGGRASQRSVGAVWVWDIRQEGWEYDQKRRVKGFGSGLRCLGLGLFGYDRVWGFS